MEPYFSEDRDFDEIEFYKDNICADVQEGHLPKS